jgi:hypothetical protein
LCESGTARGCVLELQTEIRGGKVKGKNLVGVAYLSPKLPVWTWNPLQPRNASGSDKPQSTLSREGANGDFCATISHPPRLAIGAKCWKNWSKAGCVRRARSTSLAVGSRSEFRHSSTTDLDFGIGMKLWGRLRRNWILVGNRVPYRGWDHGDGFVQACGR